ncbi:MAG: hypothetical protein A3I13_04645 [Gammaproteobacteria bacterium RIFCSPLOWO2_02_FULL_47_50]|nr:MAG: hypothetical protein A2W76_07220 [Gammaproteobacteria bacterium RIFCSPLOWO2_12_47_11]OGT78193.1 MAG: hypothetical protein A3I13_04645 [Gammaproteobacteria bacterium RIFCSPLOWO2_02_FULL_47_50]
MAITFHPNRWSILDCDFNTGFREPEMVKKRLVVVVSEAGEGRQCLCTVIPISATEPEVLMPFHHEMNPMSFPDSYRNKRHWAKCDMIYTVGYHRLDRVKLGRDRNTGKRLYYSGSAILQDIQGIRKAMLHGLKLDTLTQHL